jgi:hypothetical protein
MGADNYENLGFQVKVDGAETAVNRLDDIIDRLERIKQLQGKKVANSKKVANAQEQENLQLKRNTKFLTSYFAKLTSVALAAKRVGHFISGAIQESAAYTENLVLFQTAFGKSSEQQLTWAQGIADAYGLARNEVIKFAGTFRELASSLGIVGETANNVTTVVTNLGYDLSALYNTSVARAMEKLQSAIFTGQTKPLRYFGIDISQASIDRLFETNKALAQLGVSARNLSQSDKVLARLLITMEGARNSFGTMAKEINNLQSQFRIFQGSLSSFKLAIGNLVQEPLQEAMVYINGFIIALTNVINAFAPKTKNEETIFDETINGAEEASDAIDKLNGKLAGFDKFNVLGQGGESSSTIAVTEELNKLLAQEAEIYEKELAAAMEDVRNEAVELSKVITSFFIEIKSYDEEKNPIYGLTDGIKALGVAILAFPIIKILGMGGKGGLFSNLSTAILECATSTKGLTTQTTLLGKAFTFIQTHPIVAVISAVVGLMAYLYSTNENFRKSINGLLSSLIPLLELCDNLIIDVLTPIIPLLNGLLNIIAEILSFVAKVATGIIYFSEVILGVLVSPIELVIKGLSTILVLLETLFNWNWSSLGDKLSKLWSDWAIGDIIIGASLGLGTTIRGYADGGYTNANLIMTHENGKREWVGKAAGSSAIVNDTQMSDIMEVAVAKGVYNALSARSAMGGATPTNETIVVKIGEEAVFNAVRKTARRQGRDFANV